MRAAAAAGCAIVALAAPLSADAGGGDPGGLAPVPAGLYTPFQLVRAAGQSGPGPTGREAVAAFAKVGRELGVIK